MKVWISAATEDNLTEAEHQLEALLRNLGEKHYICDDHDAGYDTSIVGKTEYTCFVAPKELVQQWVNGTLANGLIVEGRIEEEEEVTQ